MFNKFYKKNNLVILILLGGFVRLCFLFWGAKFYYGKENFYLQGDTGWWVDAIVNLIETGTYTSYPGHEYGYFTRTPGYSFFIGIFYLLSGKNPEIMYSFIIGTQTLLDTLAIYFMYAIVNRVFHNHKIAFISSFLYALYPFIIVWNPVVYAESTLIFFILMSFYFFTVDRWRFRYIFCGIAIGIAALIKPQAILFIPLLLVGIMIKYRGEVRYLLLYTVHFSITTVLLYGAWPVRNYLNHHKLIIAQDLRASPNADIDFLAFLQYIYSVKAEFEPQFSQIIHNEKVIFPPNAYLHKEDSLKLERAIYLSQNCGSGFSNWAGYWKEPFTEPHCNGEISRLFRELRKSQIRNNPFNFYIRIPLQNLKKALFKSQLYQADTFAKRIASYLLYYRTLLILFSIIGVFLSFRYGKIDRITLWIIFSYFVMWYLLLCAGTSVQLRDIEIRYFLPADILMLIPASAVFQMLINKTKKSKD